MMVKFLENEILENLDKTRDLYYPLVISSINKKSGIEDKRIDAFITLTFQDKRIELLIEIKNRTSPQLLAVGINRLRDLSNSLELKKYYPTLLVPYLSSSVVEILKINNLCGLDPNGNYYIVTPGFTAIRLDKKNEYKESSYIKNIYSRNSSIVVRFLLRKQGIYRKVSEIFENIKLLNSQITLSTVSKVLKILEEQIIIMREGKVITLLQPEKLLQNLKDNYTTPLSYKTLRLKLPSDRSEAKIILNQYFGDSWIWSGESCAEYYASTTPTDEFTVYTKVNYNSEEILKYENTRFFNYTILILSDSFEYIFFDSRDNKASKIQTYLELSQLDKREQEIALDIKRDILNEFRK